LPSEVVISATRWCQVYPNAPGWLGISNLSRSILPGLTAFNLAARSTPMFSFGSRIRRNPAQPPK
jgi:hypothetical protein